MGWAVRRLVRLLAGLVLAWVPALALAQVSPSAPVAAPAPRWVACSLPLAPHTMPGPSGEPTGYATEVLMAVAQRLGWSIEVRYMPWLRVVSEAQEGHCDVVYTVLRRPDYERFLIFPDTPVQQRANVLLVPAASSLRFDGDVEQFMRRHTVGMYQDKAVDERFEWLRRQPWARIDVSIDARQNLLKLLHGRFEAAIENELTAVFELRQLGREAEVRILRPPLNEVPAYIAMARAGRLAERVVEFDRALAAFRQTPVFASIHRRYAGEAR